MNDELKEAKEKLAALLKEKEEITKKLSEDENLKLRLRDIEGSYRTDGELKVAQIKVRDMQFPVFEKSSFYIDRIVSIDDKWICIRTDKTETIVRYKKSTGWRERSRDGVNKIDVQKAVEIWEKHQILKGEQI